MTSSPGAMSRAWIAISPAVVPLVHDTQWAAP